jgi:hypothetical protein
MIMFKVMISKFNLSVILKEKFKDKIEDKILSRNLRLKFKYNDYGWSSMLWFKASFEYSVSCLDSKAKLEGDLRTKFKA